MKAPLFNTPVMDAALLDWKQRRIRQHLPVEGWSMWPFLRPGDEIEVEFGSERIRPGALIVFRESNITIVHRLRFIGAKGMLITRGDNRLVCDAPVSFDEVLGVVVARQRFGRSLVLDTLIGKCLSNICLLLGQSRCYLFSLLHKVGIRRPRFLPRNL